MSRKSATTPYIDRQLGRGEDQPFHSIIYTSPCLLKCSHSSESKSYAIGSNGKTSNLQSTGDLAITATESRSYEKSHIGREARVL